MSCAAAGASPPPELPIIVVSGLPRSGTSMMMQALRAGGLPLAADRTRGPDEHNPRGYFELEAVKRLSSPAEPPDPGEWRGKAVKMVCLLLYWLPQGYPYRVIAMRRKLEEVVSSQRAMLGGGPEPISELEILSIFRREMERLDAWLRLRPDIAVLPVDYNEMVRDPRPQAEAVAWFLGLKLNVNRMVEAVDATLYRHRR